MGLFAVTALLLAIVGLYGTSPSACISVHARWAAEHGPRRITATDDTSHPDLPASGAALGISGASRPRVSLRRYSSVSRHRSGYICPRAVSVIIVAAVACGIRRHADSAESSR